MVMKHIPKYANEHLKVLELMLKDMFPNYYIDGKYTVSLILWTDNDFQVELQCGDHDGNNDLHIFTWNKHMGYDHRVKSAKNIGLVV